MGIRKKKPSWKHLVLRKHPARHPSRGKRSTQNMTNWWRFCGKRNGRRPKRRLKRRMTSCGCWSADPPPQLDVFKSSSVLNATTSGWWSGRSGWSACDPHRHRNLFRRHLKSAPAPAVAIRSDFYDPHRHPLLAIFRMRRKRRIPRISLDPADTFWMFHPGLWPPHQKFHISCDWIHFYIRQEDSKMAPVDNVKSLQLMQLLLI